MTAAGTEGVQLYLPILWPSACVCSCPKLRVVDGSISRTEATDSRFGWVLLAANHFDEYLERLHIKTTDLELFTRVKELVEARSGFP